MSPVERPRVPLLRAVFVVVVLYLLSPLLTSIHVEGFTAQIQIGAVAANAGLLNRANLLYPLHAEYFYLTRLGVVYLLQIVMRVLHNDGDIAFRVVTALSFVVFVSSTIAIGRRYSRVGPLAIAMALLLSPGISELGFYFNDNVVSVAFGMLGIALLPREGGATPGERRARIARGVLSGVLLGIAILCRPDAVLLLPVLAGFAWLETTSVARLLRLGGLVIIGILAVLVGSYYVSGSTLFQAVHIARVFDQLQAAFKSRSATVLVFVLFFGLPNLALLPIGIVQGIRESDTRRILVLVLLPVLLLAYIIPNAMETRQFYPILAPFIAIHGGRALEWIRDALRSQTRVRVRAAAALVAAITVVWIAPPILVPVRDGPRPVFGRLWSPILWFRWQHAVTATLDDVTALVNKSDRVPHVVVITTHFNADHYLRLRLWQRGYLPLRAREAEPGCTGGFEVWRKGTHELVQVRTENPHFMFRPNEYLEALQIQRAFQCPSIFSGAPVYVSGLGREPFGTDVMTALTVTRPELASTTVAFGWPRDVAAHTQERLNIGRLNRTTPYSTGLNRTALLTAAEVADLSLMADQIVKIYAQRAGDSLPDYDHVMAAFGYNGWRPR